MNPLSYDCRRSVYANSVSNRRTTKFLLVCFTLIGVSLLSMLAPVTSMAAKPLALSSEGIPFTAQARHSAISLDIEVLGADPMARTLTLDWYPTIPSLNCTAPSPIEYDLYMSHDILDTTSPSWATISPYPPLFQINSTAMCQTLSQFSPCPTFRTVTKLLVSSPQMSMILPFHGQSSLQDYPFDVYIAPMVLWLIDPKTGAMSSPNITKTYGIAVNFEVSLPQASATMSDSESQLLLTFRVERSIATKVFVVVVAVTNWLTAVTFTIMCAAAVVYRPHVIYSEMFVLPVGVVFAFASIRQNMPGAPDGFGTTIDMYSTLPFLVIMTLAGLTLILLVLFRRIKDYYASEGTQGTKDLEVTGCDIGSKPSSQERCFPYQAIPKQGAHGTQGIIPSAGSMEQTFSSRNAIDATRVATPEPNQQHPPAKPMSNKAQGDRQELVPEATQERKQTMEEAGLEDTRRSATTGKIDGGECTKVAA